LLSLPCCQLFRLLYSHLNHYKDFPNQTTLNAEEEVGLLHYNRPIYEQVALALMKAARPVLAR
jgi:hypothetical protein